MNTTKEGTPSLGENLIKANKKRTRLVLKTGSSITKIYKHKLWRLLYFRGKTEFKNSYTFYNTKINTPKPLEYKKRISLKEFNWIETSTYEFLNDHIQSDEAIKHLKKGANITDSIIFLFCDIAQRGFFHTDTNAANILINKRTLNAAIIDIEEIVKHPPSASDAAALMIARFYNDKISSLITSDELFLSLRKVYVSLKWDSTVESSIKLIEEFGNKRLPKGAREKRKRLLSEELI